MNIKIRGDSMSIASFELIRYFANSPYKIKFVKMQET